MPFAKKSQIKFFSYFTNGNYTPVNTNLVVTTSSSQTHLLANDIDFDGGWQVVSVVTNPAHGTILSSGNDGAIESSIRRVINLRLKNTGTFWYEENAESMLQLRALVVRGRWDEDVKAMRVMNAIRE